MTVVGTDSHRVAAIKIQKPKAKKFVSGFLFSTG
jgi:hypothetical protein